MRIGMMLLALALATTGCKKKENQAAESAGSGSAMAGSDMGSGSGSDMAGSGSDMAAGSGSDMAGSGSDMAGSGSGMDTQMSKKAGNCPSTVLGATTKAEVKGKAVVVTITSKDKDAVAAIQKRTEELLADKKGGAGSPASGHDQKGTHGGSTGMCPVHVPEGAATSMKKQKDGVAVTITPKDKLDELKTDIDARIAKTDEWVKANIQPGDKGNQGGVGGGKGDHGANHSGEGDSKGVERKAAGSGGDGKGGGAGTGGGGGKGTGGGGGSGSAK